MKIQITLKELSDHCNWDKVCAKLGLDHYCMQWADDQATYSVTLQDLIEMEYSKIYNLNLKDVSL